MKHTTSGTLVVIAVAAVALGVVLVSRSAAVEAVYPLERVSLLFKRSVWPRVKGVFNGPGHAAENVRLRREVATLSMLTDEVARLQLENDSLRRSLGYAARSPGRWIAAPVIADHGGSCGRRTVLRVAKGSSDGVSENAVVAGPDGLIGQVTFVTAHTAEVTLLTDRTIKVACSVDLGGGCTASGILEGGGGEELVLSHVRGMSRDMPKARVATSGRGGVFPKGLTVGSLISVSRGDGGAWRGTVCPSVDFDNLQDVFIRSER